MGADVKKIFSLPPMEWLTMDAHGFADLEHDVELHKPRLLVIDPLVAYLGADVDMNRSNETRPRLAKLADIADRHNTALVLVRHLRKSRGGNALMAGLGSVDFTAAVRSVLLAGTYNRDGRHGRAVLQVKNNLAPHGPAIGYHLGVEGFAWEEAPHDVTSDDLLGHAQPGSGRDRAEAFLVEVLGGGPRPTSEVRNLADAAGLSWSTVKRAKAKLGIGVDKQGFGRDSFWVWSLLGDSG